MASLPFAFSQMFPLPVIALGLGFFPTWSSDFLHHFLSLLLLYPPALVFSSAIHSSCLICPSPGPVAAVCAGSQSSLCFASIGDVFPYLLFPCFVEKKRFSMIFLSGTFIVKNSTHSKVSCYALSISHGRQGDTPGPGIPVLQKPGLEEEPKISKLCRNICRGWDEGTFHPLLQHLLPLPSFWNHLGEITPVPLDFPHVSGPARTVFIYKREMRL